MKRITDAIFPSSKRTRTAIAWSGSEQPQAGPTLPNPRWHPDTNSPSETPPGPSFPDGVKVLHDCPDATVDICFVHGLSGNRDSTWTAKGQSTPWPKTLLPPRLEKARILTYGYNAYIVQKSVASLNRLTGHARNLLNDLTTDRASCNASCRPLIFVAHNLGGLVCKEAILSSRNNPEPYLRDIFHCTKGIIFMGTPHRGSWMADWAKIPVSAISLVKSTNKSLLEILGTDNEGLKSIQDNFWKMVRELREGGRPFEVTCFFEELPLGMGGVVVSEQSATFEGYSCMSIHANHSDMAKFGSADETGFKRLLGVLRRWKPQVEPDRISSQDRQKALLDSLYFARVDARHDSIEDAQAKTCEWLLETPEYVDWLDPEKFRQHHGLLYIDGKPGAGKSTIMKFAFTLSKKTATDHAAVISFFFHARGDDLEKSQIGMYRSLLHQLLTKLPDLQELLDSPDLDVQSQSRSPTWDIKTLRRAFSNAITKLGQRQLTCFIDALDECDQHEVQDVINSFKEFGQRAVEAGSKLYICFSSRRYPLIRVRYGLRLTLEDQTGHAEAIEKYVRERLEVEEDGSVEEDGYVEDIRTKILQKAGHIFLWVFLVVHILNEEFNDGRMFAVRKRLEEIPDRLSDLLKDILTRDKKNMADLRLCIQWILYAKRPLKREEFYFALVSGLKPDEKVEWDRREITLDRIDRFVLSSSKGLAEITRSKDRTVQFIHESVRDYLIKEGGLHYLWPELAEDFESLSHDRLKKCCQTHMQADISSCMPSGEALPKAKDLQLLVSEKFPFLSYASGHVLYHANAAASGVPQDDFLGEFSLGTWISLNNIFVRYPYKPPINLLYILAEKNLATLIRILRRHHPRINISGGRHYYPLFAALKLGHRDAVKALLEQETNSRQGDDFLSQLEYGSDFTVPEGKTPILWALDMGYMALAMAWIASMEFDIDSKGPSDRTPLSVAAERGLEAIVKLLLETGKVDIDLKDGHGRTPLSWAATNGHEAIVKLLLETGQVDVNSKEKKHKQWQLSARTPLSFAAANGHEAVVKLLIGTDGVDVSAGDKKGRTPLSFAAERGHEAIVQLLLSISMAGVDSRDKKGRTPLSWAAASGHESVVKLLLLDIYKVDVDSKDRDCRTPLSWAAENGHESVVKLLLKRDKVNVDSRHKSHNTSSGRTPLSYAAERGHEGVVKLLLETGKVDVNSLTGGITADGRRTPLSFAAGRGHEAVIKLLLKTDNIDVNLRDKSGRTPLSWAATSGYEAVVKLLLKADNIGVDLKDNGGQTPLSWAAANGYEAVVKLLLEIGKADVNLSTGERIVGGRRTPLSFAAERGHEAVVKLLLGTDNIDVDLKDKDGRTPLSWATEKGHKNIIKLLESAKEHTAFHSLFKLSYL